MTMVSLPYKEFPSSVSAASKASHSLLFNERITKFYSFDIKVLLEFIIAKSILHFSDFGVYFVKYEFKNFDCSPINCTPIFPSQANLIAGL